MSHGVRKRNRNQKASERNVDWEKDECIDDEETERPGKENNSGGGSARQIQVNPPGTFDFSDPTEWEKWLQRWERYRRLSGLDKQPEGKQIDMFIYSLGDEAEDILMSFRKEKSNVSNYRDVIALFNNHFFPKRNVIYERARFNQRVQQEGESVDSFLTDLHRLSRNCNFRDMTDELIRDRIVVGIQDRKLSEQLQVEPDLTKEIAIRKVKQYEQVQKEQKVVRNWNNNNQTDCREELEEVRAIGRGVCNNCGKQHFRQRACPAEKSKCNRCKKIGHWAQMCRGKARWYPNRPQHQQVNEIVENVTKCTEELEQSDTYLIQTVEQDENENPWRITLKLENLRVNFKIDTGADVSVIPLSLFKRIKTKELQSTNKKLYTAGSQPLRVYGSVKMRIFWKGIRTEEEFFVSEVQDALLGRPALTSLKLVSVIRSIQIDKEKIVDQYKDLFEGLGRMKETFEIKLQANAQPFALATPRRIPFALKDKVRAELDEMVKEGVISPITEPTEWCSPIVVVPKPDKKIRLCVDYTRLNKNVKREYYVLPSVEESLSRIEGAQFFSKIDASRGYWQVPVHENSKKLTCFIMPFGRYVFNRMPFGICSAPEFYQRNVAQIIDRIEGTCNHIDDVLVWGRSKEEHDSRLIEVLEKLRTAGITLNKGKCEFAVQSVKFLGHIISGQGIEPDPEKVEAIRKYPSPTNVNELRRFLGMVNYLLKFLPKMATITNPLRQLLVKNNLWNWDEVQEKAVQQIKKAVSEAPILAAYNTTLKTRLSTDASQFGLGAVLEQLHGEEWKPVYFASKSLTKAEMKYAQIEKEALGIVWAVKKFEPFILGKEVTIYTDHKPLVSIFGDKPLSDLSARLQRMKMMMMKFDYHVVYIPGKELYVPDALSRASLKAPGEKGLIDEKMKVYVECLRESLDVSDEKLEEIKKAQSIDEECKRIRECVLNGWPSRTNMSDTILNFYKFRNDITLVDNILVYVNRVFIPKSLRATIVKILHQGHLGYTKCRNRANGSVWWPRINNELYESIVNCQDCIKWRTNTVEPMIPSEVPEGPWLKIAADIFYVNKQNYLCVVDYFSKYPEVIAIEKMTSSYLINKFKSIFSRFGIPYQLRCDQGTPFTSNLFKEFAKEYGFALQTSSPHYPKSNGMAECGVKIVKNIIRKTNSERGDLTLALLAYRATPLDSGLSPGELLMGRKLRTNLPVIKNKLKPEWSFLEKHRQAEEKCKVKQKYAYDRRHAAKPLRPLAEGEKVWITNASRYGEVEAKLENQPRSYIVKLSDGSRLQRNRFHLVPAKS